MGDVGK